MSTRLEEIERVKQLHSDIVVYLETGELREGSELNLGSGLCSFFCELDVLNLEFLDFLDECCSCDVYPVEVTKEQFIEDVKIGAYVRGRAPSLQVDSNGNLFNHLGKVRSTAGNQYAFLHCYKGHYGKARLKLLEDFMKYIEI